MARKISRAMVMAGLNSPKAHKNKRVMNNLATIAVNHGWLTEDEVEERYGKYL